MNLTRPNEYEAAIPATVDFFERIHAQERRGKRSFVSGLFSTHAMTADRIKNAQKEIATILPARNQYVVNTSDFDEVKLRLTNRGNRLSIDRGDKGGPILQRRAGH